MINVLCITGMCVVFGAVAADLLSFVFTRRFLDFTDLLYIAGNVLVGIGDVMARDWAAVAINVAAIVILVWLFWRRRKRRRSSKLIGAKSRARLAAMIRSMREAKPRPVLRPVPQGAG